MKVLLIDADSTIPNLPLMKLSTWHKKRGDAASLMRLNMPYYPGRRKPLFNLPLGYDRAYCSVIFEGNKDLIKGKGIIFGGTGFDLKTVLPEIIEKLEPDYSLYPENDTSYGFLSRGCIRRCSFCKVPEKEGTIRKAFGVQDIVRHKQVKFLDNNILALPDHYEILQELISRKVKCQFTQGLDIRLVNPKNSDLLKNLRYWGNYTFAFDSYTRMEQIEKGLSLLNWRRDWQFRFFVYVHPSMLLSETTNRIEWLRERKCYPYVMRDISCWGSEHSDFYVDLASYCNQVNLFKKMSFKTFLERRYPSGEKRIKSSLRKFYVAGGGNEEKKTDAKKVKRPAGLQPRHGEFLMESVPEQTG